MTGNDEVERNRQLVVQQFKDLLALAEKELEAGRPGPLLAFRSGVWILLDLVESAVDNPTLIELGDDLTIHFQIVKPSGEKLDAERVMPAFVVKRDEDAEDSLREGLR